MKTKSQIAKRIILGSLLISSITIFDSCKKLGCTDVDADTYKSTAEKNNEADCKYRFASTFYVTNIPSTKSTGEFWDNYYSYDCDAYVRFKPKGSSSWYYTNADYNTNSATCYQSSSNVQFTNEEWEFECRDSDYSSYPNYDELVIAGTFNPLTQGTTSGETGKIKITIQGVRFEFNYTVRKQ